MRRRRSTRILASDAYGCRSALHIDLPCFANIYLRRLSKSPFSLLCALPSFTFSFFRDAESKLFCSPPAAVAQGRWRHVSAATHAGRRNKRHPRSHGYALLPCTHTLDSTRRVHASVCVRWCAFKFKNRPTACSVMVQVHI